MFDEPPKPIADVLFPPDPLPNPARPLFKSVVSVQAEPFQSSVLALGPELAYILPPKTIADVWEPLDPAASPAVFVFDDEDNAVQADPFQDYVV